MSHEQLIFIRASALHFYQGNIKGFTLKHKEHKAAGGKIL
jgi:hypothetical protein